MKCEPGDLALVIHPLGGNPKTVGMIVSVVAVDPAHVFQQGGCCPACLIRVPQPMPSATGRLIDTGWAMDENLFPLRGKRPELPAPPVTAPVEDLL